MCIPRWNRYDDGNGTLKSEKPRLPKEKTPAPAPVSTRKIVLPPTPLHRWPLPEHYHVLDSAQVRRLKEEVGTSLAPKGTATSISDISQAFIRRAATRARCRVAKEHLGETFGPDKLSILELQNGWPPLLFFAVEALEH